MKARIMKKLVFSLFVSLMVVLLMNLTFISNGNEEKIIKLSSEVPVALADGRMHWMHDWTGYNC